MIRTKEIEFLQALYDATIKNAITWKIVDDQERDIFQCRIHDERIDVEILYVQAVGEHGTTRGMVRISGLKTYMHFAVGTEGYDLIMQSLSLQIPGWHQGTEGAIKVLERATRTVRSLAGDIDIP